MAQDKTPVTVEGEIAILISDLIEEAAKEPVPPRLRKLAQQLEAALARNGLHAPLP